MPFAPERRARPPKKRGQVLIYLVFFRWGGLPNSLKGVDNYASFPVDNGKIVKANRFESIAFMEGLGAPPPNFPHVFAAVLFNNGFPP